MWHTTAQPIESSEKRRDRETKTGKQNGNKNRETKTGKQNRERKQGKKTRKLRIVTSQGSGKTSQKGEKGREYVLKASFES